MAMSFKLGPLNLNAVAQGVGGLVFGTGDKDEDNDGGVEQLLERISNGVLAGDRRAAIAELRDVVQEQRAAQLALGAMGFPVLMEVLREEREDLEMVRGALEVLISGLSAPPGAVPDGQLVPGLVNSELFSREPGSVALLLTLLEEEDFYVRYHTVQLLTVLLTNASHRLQEAILLTPQGVARLMDMLQEREVIRNEALLLMNNLTRSAEEIQKIVVFEGAFERIFNIIKEEGSSDGGIVVQDSIELLNNLLRNNPSNQVFLRETMGLQNVPALLKIRKTDGDGLSRQKAANLLCSLETVSLLLARSPSSPDAAKDTHLTTNQTALAQAGLVEALLALALEGRITSVAVRTQALRALGDLVVGHARNRDLLGSAVLGQHDQAAHREPSLNRVLRAALRASSARESAAADYVFKCFCQGNSDGQSMLASTITPLPQAPSHKQPLKGISGNDEDPTSSFGSTLVKGLLGVDGRQDLELSCRAANVLSHILKDNPACKERVLRIPLEIPSSALAPPELLMPRCMRYIAAAAAPSHPSPTSPSSSSPLSLGAYVPYGSAAASASVWLQPVLLRLLITWLCDCPPAVAAFLAAPAHLPYLVELTGSTGSPASLHVAGLAAMLLGACVVFNAASGPGSTDAATVVDVINQRIGLTAYFQRWEDMKKTALFVNSGSGPRAPQPLTRATAAAAAAAADGPLGPPAAASPQGNGSMSMSRGLSMSMSEAEAEPPGAVLFYDAEFVQWTAAFEDAVRQRIVELFARPRAAGGRMEAAAAPELEQREGERDGDYCARLRAALQGLAQELQELRERNATLAGDIVSSGGSLNGASDLAESSRRSGYAPSASAAVTGAHKAEAEALKQQLSDAQSALRAAEEMQASVEVEAGQYRQLAAKHEADLQALSDAYNTLEQDNFRLEAQVQAMADEQAASSSQPATSGTPQEDTHLTQEQLEAAREEGREEAQKESEAELNDLLVCLGQEESKVEKLRARLTELGEDVDALLEGIGDSEEPPDGEDREEEEEEEDEEEGDDTVE